MGFAYIGSTNGSNASPYSFDASAVTSGVVLTGAAGADTLIGGAGGDHLYGRDGNDTLKGASGPDTLEGEIGDDTLFAGLGQDCMLGGAGADVLVVAVGDLASGDVMDGGAGVDTIQLDTLTGGGYAFESTTLTDAERIIGGGYNDSVRINWSQLAAGGGSVIAIDLGGGVDRLEILGVSPGAFNMNALPTSFANTEYLVLNSSGGLTVTAANDVSAGLSVVGNFADTVYGSTQADTIWGGAGADQIYGLQGGDVLIAGSGGDFVYGGDGADTLFGVSGADMMYGNSGADVLVGGPGADIIFANSGADTIFGGDGSDNIQDNGPDGAGILVVADAAGESGDDSVFGNDGNDTLIGGLGDDNLRGHGGADVLIGGAGMDTLSGGVGSGDVMWGEAGADKFIFASGYGLDLIADFQPGVDKIELSLFAFSTFSQLQSAATFTHYDNGLVISFSNGDALSIAGAGATLNASDFNII